MPCQSHLNEFQSRFLCRRTLPQIRLKWFINIITAVLIRNYIILRISVAIIRQLCFYLFMDLVHKRRIAPPLKAPLKKNLLLLSPRQTGKSSYLKAQPSVDLYLNLQEADTFRKLSFQKNIIEKLLTPEMKTVALEPISKSGSSDTSSRN